ncbi:Molybdopterin binding domain protein [Tepidanaerobacter acetatoxydans Re1]|uniref:Molybdopterin binding domain protein n=1 Tax=Tepidanaerobacter acetatoxydans (strain DSM 21804 / JCM 16047 / Re1) TaxID=1209989 RepID=F4LS87_TEPAE|nr:molybdopterin-binding protein [Tepidanaerobacter acetatoxydans]AEE90350.1 molybdopterin binding domain protein [Tepidanaerobacter acetatoxydans Re1]CCP24840.1 Molybdopterin binding domain protein [Tepidanaerobacter acetatoxydans Re1]
MTSKAIIIPTGDEILNGTVVDTNSPAIMALILERFPGCEVTRITPSVDNETTIITKLKRAIEEKADLIFIIGGSGGGHRFIPNAARDFTHTAILKMFPNSCFKEIYGKNGHLWSKLIAAKESNSLLVNVPGPYVEAVAAAEAALDSILKGETDPQIIVERTSEAVSRQYPSGGEIK